LKSSTSFIILGLFTSEFKFEHSFILIYVNMRKKISKIYESYYIISCSFLLKIDKLNRCGLTNGRKTRTAVVASINVNGKKIDGNEQTLYMYVLLSRIRCSIYPSSTNSHDMNIQRLTHWTGQTVIHSLSLSLSPSSSSSLSMNYSYDRKALRISSWIEWNIKKRRRRRNWRVPCIV
jgi:hypothetical protein